MKENIRQLVPDPLRENYALKFGIVLLVLGLSVGAIGMIATAEMTDSVEDRVLEDQVTLAAQEATALDNWNDQNVQTTADLARTQVVQSDDHEAIQRYIEDIGRDVEDVHYVDTETHDVHATTATDVYTLGDATFPNSDEIHTDLTRVDVQRSAPYLNAEGVPVVAYYIGVTGTDDRAVIVTVNLAEYGDSIDRNQVIVAVDDEGRIVADDRLPGFGYGHPSFLQDYDGEFLDTIDADGENESGTETFEGRPDSAIQDDPYGFDPEGYVAAYHTTDMGWTVLVHTSNYDAYGFVNTVNQYGMLATLAGVLMIGLVGAALGRNTATAIDRLTAKASRMEDGDLYVDFETERIDNIGRLYAGFDSLQATLRDQIGEAHEARQEAEAERKRVAEMNDHIERKADAYSDVMQAAAEGDLTSRMDADSDNEAMSTIGEEFNEMIAEIEATVAELNEFATEVATASEEVTASSEEIRSASEQVSKAVQSISDGADQQNRALQSVDTEMGSLSTTTEQIAASSNEVADIAERTAQTGRDGREAAQEAIEACEELEAERQAIVDEFGTLRDEVDQIDDLTDTISEIAEQTNMLALNANIEASRSSSGEDSEGFGAVAAEVKQLSQDVKDAANEIGDRLEDLQDQTERSAQEVDRTSEVIERVNDLVTNSVQALDDIATYAGETNNGVQEISAATEEQAASTQEVVSMVDEVATISEQTSSEAENVASAAEEQTSALTEVSRSADELSQQASTLSEALDRFDTDANLESSETFEYRADENVLEQNDDVPWYEREDATNPEGDVSESDEDASDSDEDDETFSFVD